MLNLIKLIGEQPIPNILPALFLKPKLNIILYSQKTESTANWISKILSNCQKVLISAYDFDEIAHKLSNVISGIAQKKLIKTITKQLK